MQQSRPCSAAQAAVQAFTKDKLCIALNSAVLASKPSLVYRCTKLQSEPGGDRRIDPRGVNQRRDGQDEITLTTLELIDCIAALIPPPRTRRHRYYGVLAPISPLRASVTAMAMPAQQPLAHALPTYTPPTQSAQSAAGEDATGVAKITVAAISPESEQPESVPFRRSLVYYLWTALIARIYEVFPLLCGDQMRIIAFITYSTDIRQMLGHIGVQSEPPRLSPTREPPLWDDCGALTGEQVGEGSRVEPDWDMVGQPAPGYQVDQRVSW